MGCNHNCNKDINYCVPALNGDEDFQTLTASDGIYTSKIYDACGNLRIDLGCSDCEGAQNCGDITRDCGGEEITVVALYEKATGTTIPFVGCDQINMIKASGNGACWKVVTDDGKRYNLNSISCCKRICEDLPTTIEGGLIVNGDIEGKTITAEEFVGNGCDITNTDNQEVTDFYHDIVSDLLVLKTENTKDCVGKGNTEKIWSVDSSVFTHNTTNVSLKFEPDDDSDILVLTDSDGNTVSVDLEKYNNKQETYISDGSCTDGGIISLDYNPESPLYPQQVIIDISNSIQTIESAEYNPCKGEMTLCHKNGMCVVMNNLPLNIDVFGQAPLAPGWSGNIYYHIKDNVIMVSVNVELTAYSAFPPGSFMPLELTKLPITLQDYRHDDDLSTKGYTYKYLVSHSSKGSFINHVQLFVELDGTVKVTQWAIPERIQDSFCLVVESVDKSILTSICPDPGPSPTYKVRYLSNNMLMEEVDVLVSEDKYLIQPNTFVYAHHDFLIWNSMPDGSGKSYKPGFYTKISSDLDLYAQWKQVIFIVTYNSNNGTGEFNSFEFYPGVAILNNTYPRPLNTSYTFQEWNTEMDRSGTTYHPGELLYVKYDITLYAIWG